MPLLRKNAYYCIYNFVHNNKHNFPAKEKKKLYSINIHQALLATLYICLRSPLLFPSYSCMLYTLAWQLACWCPWPSFEALNFYALH